MLASTQKMLRPPVPNIETFYYLFNLSMLTILFYDAAFVSSGGQFISNCDSRSGYVLHNFTKKLLGQSLSMQPD
jgi:hypothetical protein